jgi:hypothetical protein
VCCRVRQFQFPPRLPSASQCVATGFRTHHPATFCTGVKFDNSSIVTAVAPVAGEVSGAAATATTAAVEAAIGAQFDEPRCLAVWRMSSAGSAEPFSVEVIDGASGMIHGSNGVSALCSASLCAQFCSLLAAQGHSLVSNVQRQLSVKSYVELKQNMLLSVSDANSGDVLPDTIPICNAYQLAKCQLLRVWNGLDVVASSDTVPAALSSEDHDTSTRSSQGHKRSKHEQCASLGLWVSAKYILCAGST